MMVHLKFETKTTKKNKNLQNEPIEYTGDPLEDFTVMHFLDRFVYKNPKKAPAKGKSKTVTKLV